MIASITESLVDAKDDARQAEANLAPAEAISRFDRRTVTNTCWVIGTVIASNLSILGIIIALVQ